MGTNQPSDLLYEVIARNAEATRDLREVVARQADATMALAASLNRQVSEIERLIPVLDRLKSDVYQVLQNLDLDKANVDLKLSSIDKSIALLSQNTNNIERDVREATNPRIQLPEHDGKVAAATKGIARVIEALDKVKTSTKALIAVLVFIFALVGYFGWMLHVIGDSHAPNQPVEAHSK